MTQQAPASVPPIWRRRPWQVAAGAAGLTLLLVAWVLWALPVGRALEPLASPTLIMVDSDGKPFARRGAYKEAPVDVVDLPRHVPLAFVAIEDRRFYSHGALDWLGLARAVRNNWNRGRMREGGSTITQQLAKNAFLSNDRTLRRKIQEVLIAYYLEARLSKDEILSRYLSAIYFGDGVFGLRAAARHYFDKSPEDLTISEAAMLAGVVKAPSNLAPTQDLAAARRRAKLVIAAMVREGVVTQRHARQAPRVRLKAGRQELPVGSYFADWVSPEAKQVFERAYGEVVVPTTLDARLQRQAERIVRRTLAGPGRAAGAGQAALVAMRADGSVVALVGGRDYQASQFDRASDARRQPGSTFKLFVYLAALRQGMTPDSLVLDAPLEIDGWSPQNHDEAYAGKPITLRRAFARSSNVAAVRLAEQTGRDGVIRAARDLGVAGPFPRGPTLALGAGSMTLMELTAAYAAVASGLAPVTPHGLTQNRPRSAPRRLDPRERAQLLDLLQAVVTSGTGRAAALPQAVYGKTGTSQDYRDAYFVGFTDDLVVGVWLGNDDNTPMNRVAGGGLPAQMWRQFVSVAVRPKTASPRAPARSAPPVLEESEPLEVVPAEAAAEVRSIDDLLQGEPTAPIEDSRSAAPP